MTITYDCTEDTGREVGLSSAAGALRSGRLVVTPTDTLYGIAADAFDPDAVVSLLSAKRRGPDMPVPVLVGSWETIDGLVVSTPAAARELARALLDDVGITVNKNAIPFDPQKPNIASGIRVGSPSVTTQGMGTEDMDHVADMIHRAVTTTDGDPQHDVARAIRDEVTQLLASHPAYPAP